jgi:hypothetical protein
LIGSCVNDALGLIGWALFFMAFFSHRVNPEERSVKEMDMEFASNGKGNLGVTLGAVGTGLALLGGNGGLLGGLLGGNTCHENMPINRYEATQQARISELETEVKLRDANVYTDSKLNDLRNYVDVKFSAVNDKLCAQAVHNATNDAVLGCLQGQVAQLQGLTKLVIPNGSVCPGWGNVTVTPATAPTTGG